MDDPGPAKVAEPTPADRDPRELRGAWRVASGPMEGTRLRVTPGGISSGHPSLRLTATKTSPTPSGELEIDGEHAGELVHVILRWRAAGRAALSWNDGVTFPLELELEREPSS